MDTFKQYYTKVINEMGWNPQVRMNQPGDPSRLRERPRRRAGVGGDTNALTQAREITDNPDNVDLQHAQRVLDDLGKSYDKPSNDDLKGTIIQKYRELRDLLKQKSATPVTHENVVAVAEECVRIAESIDRLLAD